MALELFISCLPDAILKFIWRRRAEIWRLCQILSISSFQQRFPINAWLVLKVRAALFDADITTDRRGPLPLQLRPVKKHQPSLWKRKTGGGLAWAVWTVVAFKPLLASVQRLGPVSSPEMHSHTSHYWCPFRSPAQVSLMFSLSYLPQPSKRARFTCDGHACGEYAFCYRCTTNEKLSDLALMICVFCDLLVSIWKKYYYLRGKCRVLNIQCMSFKSC